jgi:NAD(P)-dependent dehydrogenase (short-subunit alcohol dehydrogenase family)
MPSNKGNKLDFAGRTAIVTGGSQGIGFGVAQRLLASGANVSIWAIDQDRLEQAAAKLGGGKHVQVVSTDIGDLTSVEAATRAVLDAYGQIDVLINNAGIAGPNVKMWEFPPDAFARMMHVNVEGTFYCCRAAVPHMIARNYGRIVNISSIAGKEGNPNDGAYSTSKAAQIALTKSLAKELANQNISVNCVTPSLTQTALAMTLSEEQRKYILAKVPRGRMLMIEEAASLICWAASEENSFTTGATFDLSGGRATY